MKFAKKLQEELYQEWNDKYLDYKMMKKVLKQGSPDVMTVFCDIFEAQILKVHEFVRGQQEVIRQEISPLENVSTLHLHVSRGQSEVAMQLAEGPKVLNGHCQQLVQDIENFQGYASLNALAIRKIIKKFDKRFHMQFQEHFSMPSSQNMLLVSARDIGTWLLDPAQQCLRLMRCVVGASPEAVERPLRQFSFWVEELKAGAQLARLRVTGAGVDPTPLRLQLCGERDIGWCVKNTFIDCSERRGGSEPRRACSQPPGLLMVREAVEGGQEQEATEAQDSGALGSLPVLSLERLICEAAQVAPPPRQSENCESSPHEADAEDHSDRSPGTSEPADDAGAGGLGRPPPAPAPGPSRGRHKPDGVAPAGRQQGAGPVAASRWWTEIHDVCPVTGFPVRLLPYPPFKLQIPGDGSRDGTRLIDGPYLVLCILSSWRFEVLGKPLTVSEVSSLDAYMKRCKLGPFRLGRALELLAEGTGEAHRELEALRGRARARLEHLRHIQRVRLNQYEESGGDIGSRTRQRQRPPPPQRRPQQQQPQPQPQQQRRPPPRQPLPVGACLRQL